MSEPHTEARPEESAPVGIGAPAAAGTPDPVDLPGPDGTRGDADAPVSGPARPQPLGVTVGATGNDEVDAAVVRLGDADELPVQAHIEVYEDVHRGLRAALAALDENRG